MVAAAVTLVVLGALCPSPAWAGDTAAAADCVAVTRHQDAVHSGSGCGLPADRPLAVRWSTTLLGGASYPVVAAGKVFVVTGNSDTSYLLYALSARTGAVLWGPVPVPTFSDSLVYDAGKIIVNTFAGDVIAFAASTGRQLWTARTASVSGEPVVSDGVLFVQSGGAVFAIDTARGKRLWSTPQLQGTDGAVAVDGTGVYVSTYCSRYRLNRATGRILWADNPGCSGGTSGTAYLTDGRFFDSSRQYVLNASKGKLLGSFAGSPAFAGGVGYFAASTSLFAVGVVDRRPVFSATLPAGAVTSPVVADGVVYLGLDDRTVVGRDTTTGAATGTVSLPGPATRDLAVGQGRLIAVVGATVVGIG